MKHIFQFVRMTLIGGLLFLVPFIIVVVIAEKALDLTHKLLVPVVKYVPAGSVISVPNPRLLAIIVILLFCFVSGCFARTVLARRIVRWLEESILSHVPGYEFFKGMRESIVGADEVQKWQFVLARFDDSLAIAFLIERLENGLLAVFLPGAPSASSGIIRFLPPDRVIAMDLTPVAAVKCLKRLGAGSAALLAGLGDLHLPPARHAEATPAADPGGGKETA